MPKKKNGRPRRKKRARISTPERRFDVDTWSCIMQFLVHEVHNPYICNDDNLTLVRLSSVCRQFRQNVYKTMGLFAIWLRIFAEMGMIPHFGLMETTFLRLRNVTLDFSEPCASWSTVVLGLAHLEKLALEGAVRDLNPVLLTCLTNLTVLHLQMSRKTIAGMPPHLRQLTIVNNNNFCWELDYIGSEPFCPQLESLTLMNDMAFSLDTNLFALVPHITSLTLVTARSPMPQLFHDCRSMTQLQTLMLRQSNHGLPTILSANSTLENVHLYSDRGPFGKAEVGMFRNLTELQFSDFAMMEEWSDTTCRALSRLVHLDVSCLNDTQNSFPTCMLALRPYYYTCKTWCFPVIRHGHYFANLTRLTFRFRYFDCKKNSYHPCRYSMETSFQRVVPLQELIFFLGGSEDISSHKLSILRSSLMSTDAVPCIDCKNEFFSS